MPEIYVHAVKGRTLDQKRALVKDITDAVVKNFSVPARGRDGGNHRIRADREGQGRRPVQRNAAMTS